MSRTIDSAVTDLPLPDSPTRPSVSPRVDRERHVVDGGRLATVRQDEHGAQVLDVEERACSRNCSRCSPKTLPKHVGYLAERRVRFHGGDDDGDEVVAATGGVLDARQRGTTSGIVTVAPDLRDRVRLLPLDIRVDAQELDRRRLLDVPIDPHDDGGRLVDRLLAAYAASWICR